MSTTLPFIVYGESKIFFSCFNIISTAISDLSFFNLFKIAILLAGMTVLLSAVIKRDFMSCLRWLGSYYVLYYILFLPTLSLQIIDRRNPDMIQEVRSIPLGLGVLASMSSLLGDSITQLAEKIFQMPEELKYSRSGLMKASQLVASSASLKVFDIAFGQNLNHFIHQCVIYDWLMHKYTSQDLLQAPQAWNFISNSVSASHSFIYDQTIQNCPQGADLFQKDWPGALNSVSDFYGRLAFPDSTNPSSEFLNYLSLSYRFLTDTSSDPYDLLQSIILLNFLKEVLSDAESNLLFNTSLIERIAHSLPLLKNSLEAILYSSFMLMILFTVFPFGMRLLKNYSLLILILQTWTPLYSFLNFIGSYYAKIHSLKLIHDTLNFQSILNVQSFNHLLIEVISCLSLFIPITAFFLFKGALRYGADLVSYFEKIMASSSSGSETTVGNSFNDYNGGFQLAHNGSLYSSKQSWIEKSFNPFEGSPSDFLKSSINFSSPPHHSTISISESFYQWLTEQIGTNGRGHIGKVGAEVVLQDPILCHDYMNRYLENH